MPFFKNREQESKTILSRRWYHWEEEDIKTVWKRLTVLMYKNGKMRHGEIILGMGEDKGEWWKGWIQLWYIIRTFVNVTMYSQYNNNKRKKAIYRRHYISTYTVCLALHICEFHIYGFNQQENKNILKICTCLRTYIHSCLINIPCTVQCNNFLHIIFSVLSNISNQVAI
jgi:hypothetical protein